MPAAWDNTILVSVAVLILVLGALLAVPLWLIGRKTRRLLREGEAQMEALREADRRRRAGLLADTPGETTPWERPLDHEYILQQVERDVRAGDLERAIGGLLDAVRALDQQQARQIRAGDAAPGYAEEMAALERLLEQQRQQHAQLQDLAARGAATEEAVRDLRRRTDPGLPGGQP
jgi:hypothetical protein